MVVLLLIFMVFQVLRKLQDLVEGNGPNDEIKWNSSIDDAISGTSHDIALRSFEPLRLISLSFPEVTG